tara:strand:+ start:524 stop:1336 length:813 start_codon:yes stop_codon:yes gene_type:complete
MLPNVLKYILEGVAVAFAVTLVNKKGKDITQFVMTALSGAVMFALLDRFAPKVSIGSRFGAGFGLGAKHVGFGTGVEGLENPEVKRDSNVLYSGDLVYIHDENNENTMQRSKTSSEIMVNTPIERIVTNLSKLRVVLENHSANEQKPLKYNTTVYLMHNANVESVNHNRYIKVSRRLQSHQKGPMFREFLIKNPDNLEDDGIISPDTPVIIENLPESNVDRGFLKIEDDKTVSNTAQSPEEASKFVLKLNRVFELGDKNLCICPKEVLYP